MVEKNKFDINSKPIDEFNGKLKGTYSRKKIESIRQSEKEQSNSEEVILFFSFDVVNSSLYKTVNYFRWSLVLSQLFKKIQEEVIREISESELWRLLGDEMIFIVRIKRESDLFDYIDIIYGILIQYSENLKNGNIFENLSLSQSEKELMKLQNILSLKGAAWIAVVTSDNDCSSVIEYDNISTEYVTDSKYKICEFLGNDIDAGFRIAKETCDRRLVISFELACLLSEKTEFLSNLFIISYKRLKGIWKDKLYPIIWYYNEEISNNVSFKESFYYDEIEECELAKEYFSNISDDEKSIIEKYMFREVSKALKKILIDRHLTRKLNLIKEVINKTSKNVKKYTDVSLLEFHCVAVCYDEVQKKVLIVQRNRKKGERWEFGCAKSVIKESILDTLKNTYKSEFNIDIEPKRDKRRQDSQPIPIALYEIKKDDRIHKGIITLAKVISPIDKLEIKNKNRYKDFKWIAKSDIKEYEGKVVIEDFQATLNAVFEQIDKLEQEKVVKEE